MRDKLKIALVSLILTIFVFLSGFLVGQIISRSIILNVENSILKLQNQILSIDTSLSFINENACNEKTIDLIGKDISKIGSYIDALEKEHRTNTKVLLMKEYYNLILIKYYLTLKEIKDKCGFNYTLILFFYSNDPKYYDASVKVGKYLDYLAYKYGKKIKIFSIESYLINNTVIKYFKEKYNITTFPTLVINEKYIISNPKNIEEIEKYIK